MSSDRDRDFQANIFSKKAMFWRELVQTIIIEIFSLGICTLAVKPCFIVY
jgi:hypothetical protein